MSGKFLKFLLTELNTIRIVCQNSKCEGIVELKIKDIDRHFRDFECPLCHERFPISKDNPENHLIAFQGAIEGLKLVKDKVKIELVLPVNGTLDPSSPS